jgi:hypothetical protein
VRAYPIEPDKLLYAAERLAPGQVGPGRPPYTAHRRAASTAYYAAFHAITERVAELALSQADTTVRQRARRWIAHADISTVCRWVSGLQSTGRYGVPAHIRTLLAPPGSPSNIDADTVSIADGFLELHEKRMEADYDHEAVFTRSDTLAIIALARQVVSLVGAADSSQAKVFFGLVAMQAQVRSR